MAGAALSGAVDSVDEWQPEAFDDFAPLPPGRFDPRVFRQTAWWVDILRRPHRIADPADFTDDHLLAVVGFVLREAWRWSEFPELHNDDLIDEAWFHAEAARRIQQTPLFATLRAEASRRETTPAALAPPACSRRASAVGTRIRAPVRT